jgi:hypothetical protein
MTTLAQLKAWLKRPEHIRRILVDITGVTATTAVTPVADQNLSTSYVGTTTGFVTLLYNTYFLRSPDSGGLTFWTNLIDRSILTKRQVETVFLGGEGSQSTFYFSNGAYVTDPLDTPANTAYAPLITGGISFSESLTLDGSVSISIGDIELDNSNGELDQYFFSHIWTNRSVAIYIGDPSWKKSDFKLLFKGNVADIATSGRNNLNLVISDVFQKLNAPISDQTVQITGKNNAVELVPLTFGECFNVTPLLLNSGTLTYQVHNGPIERIIEVRDNGIPVLFTANLTAGTFTLTRAPFGQITCSVQGHKPSGTYTNKIGETIKNILTQYGPSGARLQNTDINTTNFTNFDNSFPVVNSEYTRAIGVYIRETANVLDVCNRLAKSARAQLTVTAGPQENDSDVGLLKLIKLEIASSAVQNITSSDIEEYSLFIGDKAPIKPTSKLGYGRNWTVQESGLAAGVPSNLQDIYSKQYFLAITNNYDVANAYKLNSEDVLEETLLITKTGAENESYTRSSFWSTVRYIYTFVGYPHLFDLQLGDTISLTNRRYLLNSKLGVIINISRDWINGRIQVGVLI